MKFVPAFVFFPQDIFKKLDFFQNGSVYLRDLVEVLSMVKTSNNIEVKYIYIYIFLLYFFQMDILLGQWMIHGDSRHNLTKCTVRMFKTDKWNLLQYPPVTLNVATWEPL